MDPIKIGWLGSALDGPAAATTRSTASRSTRPRRQGLLDRPVRVRPPRRARAAARLGQERDRRLPVPRRRGLHRGRGRVQLRQRDHRRRRSPTSCRCRSSAGAAPTGSRASTASGSATATAAVTPRSSSRGSKRQGHTRVAVLSEISPNGEEYFRYFRQECRRHDVSASPRSRRCRSRRPTSPSTSATCARVDADALVYMGYGMLAAKGLLRRALDELDWDPPRIMSTAFMWYLAGFEYFEGWVGIDQFDPSNPLVQGFHDAVRRPPRRGPADVAERDPGPRLRHRARARRRASSARRSSPAPA